MHDVLRIKQRRTPRPTGKVFPVWVIGTLASMDEEKTPAQLTGRCFQLPGQALTEKMSA
ncbi:hypothetical protein PSI15_17755 [Xenorhabdus sp. PR6a]|uniref:hypothetical protein n=1 Tax=Xenorhabdus sp. PR6a TaxID=3025877 RepID=UPI002358911C|nr:hypothetical protein [Xenorhabdus sp. PR6a]MDC9583351.1 hypothetical protein [Xenorhabdus sp. PR6a]